jgi:hypothetical protein
MEEQDAQLTIGAAGVKPLHLLFGASLSVVFLARTDTVMETVCTRHSAQSIWNISLLKHHEETCV